MRFSRFSPALAALLTLAGCEDKSPKADPARASATAKAAGPVKLEGVDTASLTAREHELWSELVTSLPSPCKDVAVPVAQCVSEKRACKSCKAAAEFLLRQVQAGLPKPEATAVYEARFAPDKVKSIVVGESPTRGPSDAAVTVIEFADFECPACGDAYPILEEEYARYEGKVRFVFKSFPLPAHANAKPAAYAAYAAYKQGQFWKMHHLLFENQERLTEPDLMSYAEKAGLDMVKFKADFRSDEARQRVEQEQKQGQELGVDHTPTIYINGRECDLARFGSTENAVKELDLWIRGELELAGKLDVAASAAATGAASAAVSASKSAAPKTPGHP